MKTKSNLLGWQFVINPLQAFHQPRPSAGRWNYAGDAIVYASESPSLAMLEALVHHRAGKHGYELAQVLANSTLKYDVLTDDQLPGNWQSQKTVTRKLARRWLERNASDVLVVPTVLIKVGYNLLIHPETIRKSKVVCEPFCPARFDRRLVVRYD